MTAKPAGMTQRLAEFIVDTGADDISPEIHAHAKVAFMDWMAVAMGGKDEPAVAKLLEYANVTGGNPQATILGYGVKKSVDQAALINGTASHALDYDDTLVSFFGHPSVTLFPSLLALAEWQDRSGKDFMIAYLVGLQAGATIGVCASLDHYMAGWHATSTLGHMASAAGCAKLLGLDAKQTAYALGIAATQSSGLKRVFGTMCKPFHAGKASQTGLTAALLAQKGFTSADDILEGPHGFFAVLKGGVNEEVLSMLGLGWDVVNISQKYHASCHATHSPLEAVLAVVDQHHIPLSDIRKIMVYSSKLALDAAGKTVPATGLEGKFSIPYCVANALCTGMTGNLAFTDEKIKSPDVCAMMEKVEAVLDPAKTALEANVVIETIDGGRFEGYSDILQQIPPLEVKRDRVEKKYADLCAPALGADQIRRTSEMIRDLEHVTGMKEFVEEF